MIDNKCLVILGAAGAGKDTMAGMIDELIYGTLPQFSCPLSFAAPLKEAARIIFGLDGDLDDLEYKQTPFAEPIAGCNTPRELLQWFGTGWGRSIDENLWVKAAFAVARIHEDWKPDFYVCTDCRFPNEQNALIKGFRETYFVKLVREGETGLSAEQRQHPSEPQRIEGASGERQRVHQQQDTQHHAEVAEVRQARRMPAPAGGACFLLYTHESKSGPKP